MWCYRCLSDGELFQIYGYLFAAINPQVIYNESSSVMTQEALRVTQNNLRHILQIIQSSLPRNHPLQEEMQMLLTCANERNAFRSSAIKRMETCTISK